MKLRRVYESAEEDNKPIEQAALDKFGTLEAFEEAKEERRILDEREGRRASQGRRDDHDRSREATRGSEQRYMFSEVGAAAIASRSSSSFRRPGGRDHSAPSTPGTGRESAPPTNKRLNSLRLPSEASSASTTPSALTPIPTVMTPPIAGRGPVTGLSTAELNKLQAQVLKAKLMGIPNAEQLEQEYDAEVAKSLGIGTSGGDNKTRAVRVEVLPTMDARGRLYDVGQGKNDGVAVSGNKRKNRVCCVIDHLILFVIGFVQVETHDPKTGEFVRYNADDDNTTLGDMLRQEKFGAGMADQKDFDAEFAKAIMGDAKYQVQGLHEVSVPALIICYIV